MKASVSFVVPVFNEEKRLNFFFSKIKNINFFCKYHKINEIIFVDDGSTDKTNSIIKNYKNDRLKVKIINTKHVGMMNAIFAGINKASSDYIITLEADVPVQIEEIFNIITKYNDENYDILIGSRYKKFIPKDVPFVRRLVSKSFLFLYNLFYNINVSDPQIGFKIIKKNKFHNILNNINISHDGLKSTQLVLLFYMYNYKILDVPVNYTYKSDSKNFNIKNFINTLTLNFLAFIELYIKTKKKLVTSNLKSPFRF